LRPDTKRSNGLAREQTPAPVRRIFAGMSIVSSCRSHGTIGRFGLATVCALIAAFHEGEILGV
jgi:hypothetical protein